MMNVLGKRLFSDPHTFRFHHSARNFVVVVFLVLVSTARQLASGLLFS